MKELNLSLCGDLDTQIHYSLKEDITLDISPISDFKENGIDIFNIRDNFLVIYVILILTQIMI